MRFLNNEQAQSQDGLSFFDGQDGLSMLQKIRKSLFQLLLMMFMSPFVNSISCIALSFGGARFNLYFCFLNLISLPNLQQCR